MSLNLDRAAWKRVRLGDVINRSRVQVNPIDVGVERYVAGGHIDSDSVVIERYGDVSDGQMGSTFRYVFEPGQVLYVSARPYLRKTGVPEFGGVVADKTYVLSAAPENGLLHDLLPFLLTSGHFVEYANQEATGSMNPRLLWGAMQRYEFDLPPLEDQRRIASLLWAVEEHQLALAELKAMIAHTAQQLFATHAERVKSVSLGAWVASIEAGRSPRAAAEPASADEYGVLKVSSVGRDGLVPSENKRLLNDASFRPGDAVRAGDVLITRANAVVDNVARPCLVDRDYPNLMLSDKTLRLVPSPGLSSRLLLAALQAPAYRSYVRESVNGTEAKNISQAKILAGPAPDFSPVQAHQLVEQLGSVDLAMTDLSREASHLETIKASLLHEVFGG